MTATPTRPGTQAVAPGDGDGPSTGTADHRRRRGMVAISVRHVTRHKLRMALTGLSVSLGVAFVVGTLVYTATIRRTFDDMLADTNRHIDETVRSTDVAEGFFGDVRARIDQSVVDAVRAVPGVAAAEGSVAGYTQIVGSDGTALGGFGPPTLGLSWAADDELNEATLVDGRAPGPGEVVIDRASFRAGGFALGQPVHVLTGQGPGLFTLVGTVRYGSADSPAGATLAYFDFATAQGLVSEPGRVDSVVVRAGAGVGREELRDRIAAALPAGAPLEVITGDQLVAETSEDVAAGMSFFNTFLLVFAAIALFVATFIINNTFSILVAERTRELALLRVLGASRTQVAASVLGEALLVGLTASGAGLVLGAGLAYGLKGLMSAVGFNLPTTGLVLPGTAVVAAIVVGTLVTMIASIVPARAATRIAPLAALRAADDEPRPSGTWRTVVGAVLVAAGTAGTLAVLARDRESSLRPVAAGLIAVIVGVLLLGPVLMRTLSLFVGTVPAHVEGTPGRLARQNAARHPRRTAATASALMIGVTLVGTISIIAASARGSVTATVDAALKADLVVTAPGAVSGSGPTGFSPVVHEEVARLAEVAVVAPVRVGAVEIDDGGPTMAAGVDPATFLRCVDLGTVEGDVAGLGPGTMAVARYVATEHGWRIGDVVTVSFTGQRRDDLRVVATFERRDAVPPVLLTRETARQRFRDDLDQELVIRLADGVSPEAGRRAVASVTDRYANLRVMDITGYKAQLEQSVDQLLGLVYALLMLSVVIALVGIANTLTLAIHERIRELGLLRAIGMTRRQVRASVRAESVIIAVVGTALGLVLALGAGTALALALEPQGISQLVVPVGQLALIAGMGALAGVLAAALPARRAARVEILRAVG